MITVSYSFDHSFKIMRVPQPIISFRAPPQTVQILCYVRGADIDVPYICCLDGWVPETDELWAIAEDGVR